MMCFADYIMKLYFRYDFPSSLIYIFSDVHYLDWQKMQLYEQSE